MGRENLPHQIVRRLAQLVLPAQEPGAVGEAEGPRAAAAARPRRHAPSLCLSTAAATASASATAISTSLSTSSTATATAPATATAITTATTIVTTAAAATVATRGRVARRVHLLVAAHEAAAAALP